MMMVMKKQDKLLMIFLKLLGNLFFIKLYKFFVITCYIFFFSRSFPNHFNESCMFNGGSEAIMLKEEFRQHFLNVSRIMDCVGCDKCKLWGKLQVQGLGTALKILFSGKFDEWSPTVNKNIDKKNFYLERSEIVALFNGLGR